MSAVYKADSYFVPAELSVTPYDVSRGDADAQSFEATLPVEWDISRRQNILCFEVESK